MILYYFLTSLQIHIYNKYFPLKIEKLYSQNSMTFPQKLQLNL